MIRRTAALTAAAALAGGVSWAVRAAWGLPTALGASRRQLRPTVAGSPQFADGKFHNAMPTPALEPATARGGLLRQWHDDRHKGLPGAPVPLAHPEAPEQAGALAGTRDGHSPAPLGGGGRPGLVGPVWGERVSPSPLLGPTRLHPVPVSIAGLPRVDAVLISHDHYDHLDLPTVRALLRTQSAPFVVPLGIGVHLRGWGVPEDRIVELDWDQATTVAGLTLTCTEARHFSGRFLARNTTPWSSRGGSGPEHPGVFGGGHRP